ncbi:hypothetical protein JHN63_20865 [Streptomyces sp. MBT65]|uniref:hypothetical protein n=1 Tax=Streptomyces sp. MBT65 TaxID=1488395 RepID=UPI00190ACE91|nr:hypothetical protein [Streptomyces sp. MBT65]MBK3576224.1 hypothetical protein [Streptomyces sp. MBT65]
MSGIAIAFTGTLLAAPASAEPGDAVYSANGWSEAQFFDSFDTKRVCDDAKDGHSGVGKFRWSGGSKTVWDTKGANTCEDDQSNIPENVTVYYKACIGESSTGKIWDCGIELWQDN